MIEKNLTELLASVTEQGFSVSFRSGKNSIQVTVSDGEREIKSLVDRVALKDGAIDLLAFTIDRNRHFLAVK